MDPTYFMQSQDLRTTDDDIADPINERLTLAERNERLQNQLRSLKEDLSHTRDETGQLLPIAKVDVVHLIHTTRIMFSKGMGSKRKYWISEKNKGMSVSICLNFKGIFQSQYSLF